MVASNRRSRPLPTSETRSAAQQCLVESPFQSVTVLFGLGLAVGFMVGHTIAESVGGRLMHHDTFTEKLTCQIRDLLKTNLPEGLARHV